MSILPLLLPFFSVFINNCSSLSYILFFWNSFQHSLAPSQFPEFIQKVAADIWVVRLPTYPLIPALLPLSFYPIGCSVSFFLCLELDPLSTYFLCPEDWWWQQWNTIDSWRTCALEFSNVWRDFYESWYSNFPWMFAFSSNVLLLVLVQVSIGSLCCFLERWGDCLKYGIDGFVQERVFFLGWTYHCNWTCVLS